MRYLSENKREDMRMKKRTAARSMAALMGAAMVLTACGGGNTTAPTTGASSGGETQTASESAESGKITKTDIVVGQASDIVTLDPAGQQDTTSGVLMKHAYSTLLDVDNEGKVVPDLAESYEMKSDTEYVFKLREDACFWDGTPVTAQDVKFSLDRAKGMPKTKSNTSKIEEVTVNGDHEVTIKLTEPYAAFKTIVTQHNLSILSEKAVTEAGDSYGDVDNLLGSGPFKVTEWVPNDHYTLVRNDNYWGEMPIATSITCRVIPEGSARTIALEAGEIDVVWSVDPTDCANVESNPDVKLLSQPSTGIDYVGMNTQKEKFSDRGLECKLIVPILTMERIDKLLVAKRRIQAEKNALKQIPVLEKYELVNNSNRKDILKELTDYELKLGIAQEWVNIERSQDNLFKLCDVKDHKPVILQELDEIKARKEIDIKKKDDKF